MIKKLTNQLKENGSLMAAFMTANVLNFAFNAYLARSLSLNDYGLIALLNTLWTVLLVGSGALTQVTSYQVALTGDDLNSSYSTYLATRNITRFLAGITAAAWVLMSPLLQHFFHLPSLIPLIAFAPMILLGLLTGTHRGYVQGRLHFNQFGILFLIEAGTKLALAVVLVQLGMQNLAYLSLPLSVGVAWVSAVAATRRLLPRTPHESRKKTFPWTFLGANVTTSLGAMTFLSIDLILAKHYLTRSEAGLYAMLSLIGKMIYFAGSLLNSFILPMLGASEANGSNPRQVFWRIYALTSLLAVMGFVVLGPLGHLFVPMLFGSRSKPILPELVIYCAGITLFTLANVNVIYHLAKKHYIFPLISFASAVLMAVQILLRHGSIDTIAHAVLWAGAASFVAVTAADLALSGRRPSKKDFQKVVKLLTFRRTVVQKSDNVRILIFNWRDMKHAQAGGAEVYIYELAKRWRSSGHKVTLFSGNDGESPRYEEIDGVQIHRRGSFYLAYVWALIYYFTRFRGRFDVIVDCHNGVPFFTPLYAKEPVLCVVHHVHQDVFDRFLPRPLALIAKFLEAQVMPWAYRNSHYMTVSESSKRAMIDELGIESKKIEIIHNGVNLNRFAPGTKSTVPTVLYVGRLKSYKSVDVLIRAFAKVATRYPSAILNVAGAGDAMTGLQALTSELSLEGRVNFLGFISEDQKIKLMQEAWIVVNPSYAEGWGITTIEANACGTPVIASNVAGLRDSVNAPSSGYLVPYGDANAFASKINMLLKDEVKRYSMSENAKSWANNFDWQGSATSFLERIERMP